MSYQLMYPSVLGLLLPGARPEIRLFLTRYWCKFGYGKVQKEVKKIAADLDVTVAVATTSLSYLANNGYLSKGSFVSEEGDRVSCYLLNPNLEQQLSDVGACQYRPLIDDLLTVDSGRRSKRRHALNLSCRLLMAILLNNADEFGIVEGLGLAELSKLTGMNKDRLDSNLVILKEAGYVRSHIAGITCGYLFGKRPRVYVLNIRHASFTQEVKFCVTTIDPFLSVRNPARAELDEAYSLAGIIRGYIRNGLDSLIASAIDDYELILGCDDSFVQIIDFFKDPDWRYRSYFQAKLEKYASFLLSYYWRELLENKEIDKDQLIASIKSEVIYMRTGKERKERTECKERKVGKFRGRAWVHPEAEADESVEEVKAAEFSEEQYVLLVDFICTAGCYLAKRVQHMLVMAHKESGYRSLLHEMTHHIVPCSMKHRRGRYIVVDSYHEGEGRNKSICYLVDTNTKGEVVAKKRSLSLQDQYQCGLLTKPNIKTVYKPAEVETK